MGRSRKRFNAKARTNGEQTTSNAEKADIEVCLDTNTEKYDESNPLVLSAKKKKSTKTPERPESKKKPLTKKQRKKLEQILERKKKKSNRAELLEKLSKVQAKPEEMQLFTSTSQMQTFGMKRCAEALADNSTSKKRLKVSNIKGINKKKNQPPEQESESEESSSDSDTSKPEQEENTSTLPDTVTESVAKEVATKKEETVEKAEVPKVEEAVVKKAEIDRIPTVFVTLNRKPEIQATREALPIFCEEQAIVEAIKEHPVVIIHGETGSGKTTQVPQFLYEAGFTQNGKVIGITEPRRIAAMTMAARVGEEMNAPEKVSYHIRYEKTVGKDTEIKFMTDGVLLKEMQNDFCLSKYSVVIIDEAHERSVFSDVLIGLLSRIIKKREKDNNPLKLIIMSATMRVEDFMNNDNGRILFKPEPHLITVDSRQHKVQIHFNIQTPDDYISAAYNKVCKIHRQLPPGAILVFLTGEKEINNLCKILRQTFPCKTGTNAEQELTKDDATKSPSVNKTKRKKNAPKESDFCDMKHDFDLDNFSVEPNTEDELHRLSADAEDDCTLLPGFKPNASEEGDMALHVLPLYAILPYEEQQKVFKPPPAGSRLCVVATNVAETSITIPGLKYVVDSGKVKVKQYQSKGGGISKFEITWCSKASANQRAGRCGRTEGGHCYRLYSSAVFEHKFPLYSAPEILRTPVDDIVLTLKARGIERVVDFPFPSPPDKDSLKQAEKRLVALGALQNVQTGKSFKEFKKWEFAAKITKLGTAMSRLPLSPRYAKMLLLSVKHKCIRHVVAIVSALTVSEVFLNSTVTTTTDDDEEETRIVQEGYKKIGSGQGKSQLLGDVMVLLRAVAMYEESKRKGKGGKFCARNGISLKSMQEIQKMSSQLIREINREFLETPMPLDAEITPLQDGQVDIIRKIMAACLVDRVARKIPREDTKDEKSLKNAYKCLDCEDPVFIHPASSMFQRLPEYVVYTEIMESSKLYMKGVVEIEAEWLPDFAPTLCELSPPLEKPPPTYDSDKDKIYCCAGGTFGPWQWELPITRVEMPKGLLKYQWFCRFLLEGEICPATFAHHRPHLLSPPDTMLRSWAKTVAKTKYLLQAVISKDVDSRESLRKIWKKEPKYLLHEYLEWLPNDKHVEVELTWPPKL